MCFEMIVQLLNDKLKQMSGFVANLASMKEQQRAFATCINQQTLTSIGLWVIAR